MNNRLKLIAELVPKNSVVSDIGCDHALLGAYLLKNKIVKKVISTDINIKPLENAKRKHKNIDFKLGDGLEPLALHEVDTVVISGLGGVTIKKILSNKKIENSNTVIISPNSDSYLVRKQMIKNNFFIENEKLVESKNKIYEIIVFKKGKKKYTYKELWLGPIIIRKKTKLFYKKYKKHLIKYLSFYKSISFGIKKLILKQKINILKKEGIPSK